MVETFALTADVNSAKLLQNKLFKRWIELENTENVFRYKLNVKKRNILQGKFNYLIELNSDRIEKRRKPQYFPSVTPSFNPDNFHFNKIDKREIILIATFDNIPITFLINNSPLTKYHTLLCPNLEENNPQILTWEAIAFTLVFQFNLQNRNIKIGYNSFGAFASVNHLHMHLLYIEHKLYIEDANIVPISKNLYKLDRGYPANGFCFVIDNIESYADISKNIYKMIEYFNQKNIPYNVGFIYGMHLNKEVVKIFVYPRQNSCPTKEYVTYNVAFCELSGYISVGKSDVYDCLTEESIIKKIAEDVVTLSDEMVNDIITLYT